MVCVKMAKDVAAKKPRVRREGRLGLPSLTGLPTLAARKASRGFDIDFKMGCTKR